MPYTNWQLSSSIITVNEITNEIISGTRKERQQIAITENKRKWLSTLPPHKALLCLIPSHPQFHHKLRPLEIP